MEVLADNRFQVLVISSAILVFLITFNGQMRRNMRQAVFGFLGLVWLVVAIAVFVLFGWRVGLLFVAGSYFFGVLLNPIQAIIVGTIRGDFTKR